MSEELPLPTQIVPSITVSVVSHGHGDMIADLLTDLSRVLVLRGALVIVTFNIPESAPPQLVHGDLTVISVHNPSPRGFAANHNAAFERTHSDLFLVLNPDARVPPDGFDALLKPFVDVRVGLVVPAVTNSAGLPEDSLRGNLTPWSIMARRFAAPEARRKVGVNAARSGKFFWAAGMFMLFRSRAFSALGGFDPGYFLYCEDYDICARLWLAGWQLCPIDYVIVHDAQRATGRSYRHLRWHLLSLLRVWRSRPFWAVSKRDT